MEQITLPIYNSEGKEIDNIKLNSAVFDGIINKAVIYQAVTAYRASLRKGLAGTKTRGEVSGGGKKPWRQKGTGRARVGSTRSPLWRHGGVVFGPHPRDFSYSIPKKIKDLALKSSLNAKVKSNDITVLDNLRIDNPKTKEAAKIFANLKIAPVKNTKNHKILVLLKELDKVSKLALRNISFLNIGLAKNTNCYDVLKHKKLVVTKDALKELEGLLKK